MVKKNAMSAKLQTILNRRLKQKGWSNLRQFCVGTRIPLSGETVRRVFGSDSEKGVEPATLMIVCKYLDYSPGEIQGILREHTTDTDIWPLLAGDTVPLNTVESAILEAAEKILAVKGMANKLADCFELLGMAAKVDVAQHVTVLRRK